jgi:competence protein ComEA
MAAHVCSLLRWGSRPMELERESSLAYRIDLNHAPPAELVQLPGIGATLAERIADYRGRRGGFRSVDELVEVGGIGPATLERLRPWVWVDAARSGDDPQTPSGAARPSRPSGLDTPAVPAREFGAKKIAALTGPIDINRATVEELQRLPGIGPKLSQRIVDERGKGLFKAPEDLKRVSGIGPKTLERVRPYVIVGSDLPKGGTAD